MYLSKLYPTPGSFTENEAERFTFGGSVAAVVRGLDVLTAERVRYLWHRFSCDACELTLAEGGEGYRFTIGQGDAACILRRLRDAEGSFEESGWRFCEVEK